ncbi:hypothetical protein, partial [Mycobacterium pseudoshottsii]|uniref:hypothetical protein n=1 Tax=Mycobacterium pseudoshottsii TaxID=265949 RepID=UPI003FD7EF2C
VTNSIVLQIARAYTPAPIARHQRSSTQLTSLLINNAGALGVTRVRDVFDAAPDTFESSD